MLMQVSHMISLILMKLMFCLTPILCSMSAFMSLELKDTNYSKLLATVALVVTSLKNKIVRLFPALKSSA